MRQQIARRHFQGATQVYQQLYSFPVLDSSAGLAHDLEPHRRIEGCAALSPGWGTRPDFEPKVHSLGEQRVLLLTAHETQ